MGIRADKRRRREEALAEAEKNKPMLPNGKMPFPPHFTYMTCCRDCGENREFQVSYRGTNDVMKSMCRLKCRNPLEVEVNPMLEDEKVVKVSFQGNPDVQESCPYISLLLMQADIDGLFEKQYTCKKV